MRGEDAPLSLPFVTGFIDANSIENLYKLVSPNEIDMHHGHHRDAKHDLTMGGHAFCKPVVDKNGRIQPALYTPRLPPRVYEAMKDFVKGKLEVLFNHVVIPIEHPEKADHGDVDVLVCGFKDGLCSERKIFDLRAAIALQLGADEPRSWCDGNQTGFFAVSVPPSIRRLASVSEPDSEESMLGSSSQYWVQIDVQIVRAEAQLGWHRFRIDHATLQPILTLGLRPAGFIFMNDGFYIRIPGPDRPFGEKYPKTPLIFLTSDVSQLLQFLGLPLEPYCKAFNSCETYWSWVSSARYLAREYLQPRTDVEDENADKDGRPSKDKKVSGYKSGLAYYFSRRDSMRKFTEQWLPAHPHIGIDRPNIDKIFEEALRFFNAKKIYQAQWNSYLLEGREERFWGKVIAKLSQIKFAELVSEVKPEVPRCGEILITQSPDADSYELARACEGEKWWETQADELEQQQRRKVRKLVNEAVITLKRRVKLETSQDYGRYPVLKEEPISQEDYSMWLAGLEEGGLTEDALLDWVASHAFSILKNERDRTRPAREAKRLAKKEAADRLKCLDGMEKDSDKRPLFHEI
ncbi:hypothetical protein FKW77_004945 [Venturia effusa]|uniref:Uncharacterized protein n=1 Tax=Venturia effusa TaxID=50376 RepID=A0A517L1A5_9PEZI|nr:hypothetical protein FKW77_004945 [Venturia effusa]